VDADLKCYIERKVLSERITIPQAVRALCRVGMLVDQARQKRLIAAIETAAGLDPVTDSEYPREGVE
jgi:hypothetical protein